MNDEQKALLDDGIRVVTECDLWEWLRSYTPHLNEGFALDYHPNLVLIYSKLKLKPPLGTEFGWMMKELRKHALQRTM